MSKYWNIVVLIETKRTIDFFNGEINVCALTWMLVAVHIYSFFLFAPLPSFLHFSEQIYVTYQSTTPTQMFSQHLPEKSPSNIDHSWVFSSCVFFFVHSQVLSQLDSRQMHHIKYNDTHRTRITFAHISHSPEKCVFLCQDSFFCLLVFIMRRILTWIYYVYCGIRTLI